MLNRMQHGSPEIMGTCQHVGNICNEVIAQGEYGDGGVLHTALTQVRKRLPNAEMDGRIETVVEASVVSRDNVVGQRQWSFATKHGVGISHDL